jgi:hypothetical protein
LEGYRKKLALKLTCSTVVLVKPIMKGSKNSERFCISADVTNLKNITTKRNSLSRKMEEMRSRHLGIGTGLSHSP